MQATKACDVLLTGKFSFYLLKGMCPLIDVKVLPLLSKGLGPQQLEEPRVPGSVSWDVVTATPRH
jgi:hypothetical protein